MNTLLKTLCFTIFFLLGLSMLVSAQDTVAATRWKKSLIVDVTTTQTAYSDSWVGGEIGSFNWVGNLNGAAEKNLKPWFNFRSTLKLSFGQTISQDTTKNWNKPRKSTDLIDFENVGRFILNKIIDPYVAFRLESQFVDASIDAKKRYLSPLKLTESAGLARRFYEKDNDQITSRLGLALRQTFKTGITDSVLLTTEDSTFVDGGIESVTDVNLTLSKKMTYTGKLTLFKALFFSQKDDFKGTPQEDYWKTVDVSWENIISANLSKIITVNFYTQFLYDKQVSTKGRLKETLGIGFVFKLI
ncbi:MAG: DUF3078 domain-containing protein [candidate division Zixibacteria bacterium]|nr:DUF3078 domain-containing protein [candidate division Zixibacteria bacterium]MDD5424913.1 DUF3078 domain-containing protein [candidate division Zixibacteria bacterium]